MVKDANIEYVQKFRVSSVATDQQIQKAFHELYKTSPQGSLQGYQDSQRSQGSILSMNKDSGPQGRKTRPTMVAATAISKIHLNNQLKIFCILSFRIRFLMLKFYKSYWEERDKSRRTIDF